LQKKENTLDKNLETIIKAYAMSYLGVPYRWGGSNPISGVDCSGYVINVLKAAGVIKDQRYDATAQGLFEAYSKNGFAKADFGALAFYGRDSKTISHVAFCLSDKQVIEAGAGGSSVVDKESADLKNAYVRIRPLVYRKDFLFCVMPKY
jgi:peptidoglycan DL-endopeptidase CwlO